MENKNLNILLAEDDKNLGTVLKAYLDAKNYQCTLCVNGKEALEKYKENEFDFLILDVMMPVMDGFTLAREIRETDQNTPILFLTAKSLQEDVMEGFKAGGDDYLSKPFHMDELLARIEAILRRAQAKKTAKQVDSYTIGNYSFDVIRHILSIGGVDQKLTSKEAALLELLCASKNETLDRSEALKKIWLDDSYFNARSMDVYVTKLRKYLKGDPTIEILNVHGVGFKLITSD
ncbi:MULTISPECIES: response regulator transcription factor [unclassified Lentimicrobium]|uniref:response regulator transcription factor n=1 Tax=unclassified Lentimicrobium TaxID=2677434 RepID=UPI001555BB76|nr:MULTISPECIES: response regulator transcription factor [unclassified Lentimicrobium]NPD44285.1 response regulator transcription factor [Lentimicrobium sp. S6]NPD84610.1 response regulator transcription factor [Lentimicrobium sp. L6]